MFALALSVPLSLTAQEQPKTQWSVVTMTTIKPDARAEYEAWQKQITAAYKKAEVPSRTVVQTIMGDVFEYISIAPVGKFADLDGPTPIERALGKEPAAALLRKGGAYIVSVRRFMSRDMPELSIRTPESEPSPLAMVSILHVVPGRADDFAAWVKDEYLPAAKKAEIKNLWVTADVHGSDPNERVIVRPVRSMAEFDGGPFTTKALGAEGARKMMSKTNGIVDSMNYRVVRYRADLSYQMARPSQTAKASQ
jgi:hypothetical protein